MTIDELSPGLRESILRHNWWGHDGRWYMCVARELGFEKANEMNMAINKAVGKMETRNLMALSGMSREDAGLNLLEVLKTNFYLCAQDVFEIREFVEENGRFVLKLDSCIAHSGTQKAGFSEEYQCACFKRIEGWFEGLGLNGTASITRSLARGDPLCEIVFSPA